MHASTTHSAFKVIYGREPVLPIDLAMQGISNCKVDSVCSDVRARKDIHDSVRMHLAAAADSMKRAVDKHRR